MTSIIASETDPWYPNTLRNLRRRVAPERIGARNANLFKDIEHLLRLAAVIVTGLVAFVILRAAVVPRSFGQYGHYRGAAIGEIASRPVALAGHEACEVRPQPAE